MNRVIKTALTALLAISITSPVLAAPEYDDNYSTSLRFSDIYTEDFEWARVYINLMAQKGLISGYEDGTFRPDNDVTRLEGLSLFARAMGSNDSVNAELLEIAHEKYDSVIRGYGLSWGTDEIAYLMYKGVLKKTDLDTYLSGGEKDAPMRRYEAAIIITKAMGGEDSALSDFGIILDYEDAREVPSNAIQYVAYATENGIMEGMGDGIFSPNTEVKRSQMAVMLSRTVDKVDYSFIKAKLTDVNTGTRTVTIKDSAGRETEYNYTDSTIMRNLGDETQPANMKTNVDAIVTLSGRNIVSVDTLSDIPDQTIRGKYVSYTSTSGKTTIKITPIGEATIQSYECASDVSVTYDGSPATVRSIAKDDIITLELVNGKIAKITGETKTTTISGAIVENIDVGEDITLTISHGKEEYNGMTYYVSDDVDVKKNDVAKGLDSVYKGDKVTLTLEYGTITKIVATSNSQVVEGTIQSLTISSNSTMEVKVNNTVKVYDIPKDVEILINNEEGTLYDFRVGDRVKLTLDSDAIKKIVATTTQESLGNVTGVVTSINTSYGVISVLPSEADDAKQVFCKDTTTTFISAEGKSKKMSDIKVGQTVDVRGTVSNGVFVGKLVVIVSEE